MDDLEIVRRCAERMWLRLILSESGEFVLWNELPCFYDAESRLRNYDPLHNKAQAMELVERFQLAIEPPMPASNFEWEVWKTEPNKGVVTFHDKTLLRAICECIANLPEPPSSRA